MESRGEKIWNTIVQVCLPSLTVLGFFLTASKLPQYGVIVGLVSEIFWAYASYRSWKEGQWGIAVTTTVVTIIFIYGILNYWFF
ncbi:MAG TPA: hypothetical protein VMH91_01690 [Candidatus Paceibacterota bacterium]|nr:hypothetical protein [Candidatus Paceibacterota bacterium]